MMAKSVEDDTNDLQHEDEEISPDAIFSDGSLMRGKVIAPLFESGLKEKTNGSPALVHSEKCEEAQNPLTKGYLTYITQSKKSDYSTTKFQGLDIRSSLVPTLEKIWSKRGNILQKSVIRNCDLIASALESLANAVLILESNSPSSISECEADYLSSALSDLKYMRFEVDWLLPYVEKAIGLYTWKVQQDSLKKLAQLKVYATEQRSILLDQAAKFKEVETKMEIHMAKLSANSPYTEEANFDEPLGMGLT